MRLAIAVVLLSGCADAVRNGYFTGPHYEACMDRIGLREGDDRWGEADEVCRRQARRKGSSDSYDVFTQDGQTDCVTKKDQVTGEVHTTCRSWDYRR